MRLILNIFLISLSISAIGMEQPQADLQSRVICKDLLHDAAFNGNVGHLEEHLNEANFFAQDGDSRHIFHFAILSDCHPTEKANVIQVIYGLVKTIKDFSGKNFINAQDVYGKSIMHYAIELGQVELLAPFIDDGLLDLTLSDKEGNNAAHYTINRLNSEAGKTDRANALLVKKLSREHKELFFKANAKNRMPLADVRTEELRSAQQEMSKGQSADILVKRLRQYINERDYQHVFWLLKRDLSPEKKVAFDFLVQEFNLRRSKVVDEKELDILTAEFMYGVTAIHAAFDKHGSLKDEIRQTDEKLPSVIIQQTNDYRSKDSKEDSQRPVKEEKIGEGLNDSIRTRHLTPEQKKSEEEFFEFVMNFGTEKQKTPDTDCTKVGKVLSTEREHLTKDLPPRTDREQGEKLNRQNREQKGKKRDTHKRSGNVPKQTNNNWRQNNQKPNNDTWPRRQHQNNLRPNEEQWPRNQGLARGHASHDTRETNLRGY